MYLEHELEKMKKEQSYFVFISDLKWFVKTVYSAEKDMKGFLETLISKGRLHNIYFIAEMNISDVPDLLGYKIYDAFVSYKTGIHFGGKVVDNSVLSFDYLSFADQAKPSKVGIGLLPNAMEEKDTRSVIIPDVKKKN